MLVKILKPSKDATHYTTVLIFSISQNDLAKMIHGIVQNVKNTFRQVRQFKLI